MAEANMQTTGTLAADVVGTYIADTLLDRAEKNTVFYDVCKKEKMPEKMGEVIQFTRFERMALPTRPLEEGVTPRPTRVKLSKVTAMLDQWGMHGAITDRAEMTIKHPVLQQVRDLLADAHEELVDREIQVVLMGSTGVTYPGVITTRATITAADIVTTVMLRKITAQLRRAGARPYDSRGYKGIIGPELEADINADPTFSNASAYSQIATLRDFDIGKWMGVWWQRSNYIPIFTAMAAGDVTESAVTGGSIPAGATAFTAASTVRIKVTRRDAETGFEEDIYAEAAVTDVAAFAVQVIIESTATSAIYRLYSTLQDGAAGTATLQVGEINHTAGSDTTVYLVKAGSGLASNVFVVTGTGAVAPPDNAAVNVHTGYVFGKNAVACVNLGGGMEAFFVPRKASESDPLAQRARAGWKRSFKACVLNPDYFRRFEAASAY